MSPSCGEAEASLTLLGHGRDASVVTVHDNHVSWVITLITAVLNVSGGGQKPHGKPWLVRWDPGGWASEQQALHWSDCFYWGWETSKKPSADTEPNLQHTKTMSWETHVFPPTFIYNYYIHETHTHIYLHVVFW